MIDPQEICLQPNCHDSSSKELPSVLHMSKELLGSAKDIVMGIVQNEGVFVSDDIQNTRMTICNSCEFFRAEDNRCAQCGCFMETKSKFKKTSCPLHKWNEVNDE